MVHERLRNARIHGIVRHMIANAIRAEPQGELAQIARADDESVI
jgi:hypothetical protein